MSDQNGHTGHRDAANNFERWNALADVVGKQLSKTELLIMQKAISHADHHTGELCVGVAAFADAAGVLPRNAERALAKLSTLGILRVITPGGGRNRPSLRLVSLPFVNRSRKTPARGAGKTASNTPAQSAGIPEPQTPAPRAGQSFGNPGAGEHETPALHDINPGAGATKPRRPAPPEQIITDQRTALSTSQALDESALARELLSEIETDRDEWTPADVSNVGLMIRECGELNTRGWLFDAISRNATRPTAYALKSMRNAMRQQNGTGNGTNGHALDSRTTGLQ